MKRMLTNVLVACLAIMTTCQLTAQTELITNGDFETGDLSGWSLAGAGNSTGFCPTFPRTWNVSATNSTGCNNVGSPISGTYAAYNMLDGNGNITMSMYQTITLPSTITQADLSFLYSVEYVGFDARSLQTAIYDASRSTLLATLDFQNFSGVFVQSWLAGSGQSLQSDVTSQLAPFAGQTVVFDMTVSIPRRWSGPAGLAVDDVSLAVIGQVAPIPTVGEWALIFIGVVVLFGGVWMMKEV